MAAKLQCEICGGKLIGKPGGIFECESCGTEYSNEWAKEKIQEIKGTVKVEGTVDVKGSVQVEGTVNAQSLVKRGNLALEDEKWDDAKKYFDEALNADPENAEAYLGLAMAKTESYNKEAFALKYIDGRIDVYDNNLNRAIQFADEKLITWLTEIEEQRKVEKERKQIEEDERKKEDERKRTERVKRLKEAKKYLYPVRERISKYRSVISASDYHTVGLRADGKVVATRYTGNSYYGQCNVQNWRNIVAVSAGESHTIGLKADGTVVAVGSNYSGVCDVQSWRNIIAISAGDYHTVGLKADGTVVATKYTRDYYHGQCDVQNWKNIVAVSAGRDHIFGLKADGSVNVVGGDEHGFQGYFGLVKHDRQRDVRDWTDIVAVSAGRNYIVGLKADGTVVAVGDYRNGKRNVESWTDIVAVSAGDYHTVGLKADGTVVATRYIGDFYKGQCDVQNWTDIVAVSAGKDHTVGLKADGTVVATKYTGDYYKGQCNVQGWKLFKTVGDVYIEACQLQNTGKWNDIKNALSMFKGLGNYKDSPVRAKWCYGSLLTGEKSTLQTELTNLKGIFSGKRRKEIEARLAQIDNELKKL